MIVVMGPDCNSRVISNLLICDDTWYDFELSMKKKIIISGPGYTFMSHREQEAKKRKDEVRP